MKNKQILIPLVLSLVSFGVGYFLSKGYDCGYSIFCYELVTKALALCYGSGALAIVFFILLFAARAFSAWKKFAVWFVPLAAILFIFYPEPGSGDLFSPYPEQVFQLVIGFYVLISFVIIAWKHFSAHRDSGQS